MLKPEITITLFPRKKKVTTTEAAQEPNPVINVEEAKAALTDLGKQFFTAAGIVAIATVGAATIGGIAVVAVNHALNK